MQWKRAKVAAKKRGGRERSEGRPFIWRADPGNPPRVGGEPSGFWECMITAMATSMQVSFTKV